MSFKITIPYLPSTYKIVLIVSTGVKNILNIAAIVDALKVFIEILKSFVTGLWSSTSKVSLLEKVSPNLDKGPCNKATGYPL